MLLDTRVANPRHALAVSCLALVVAASIAGSGRANDNAPMGLEEWGFLVGEWSLEEKRYDFDGELIHTNTGQAQFSLVMSDQRIQELQSLPRGDEQTTALHLFVFDPRSEEIEIARTDSGHYGFWVIIGTLSDKQIQLRVKHPNPESDITRRITYRRLDSNHFTRQLEFSTDKGETWFVRSEWNYIRR